MKIFTVGPVEMYDSTLEVRSKQIPYFRTEEFSKIMLNIEKQIKKFLETSESSKLAVITGSGTASMEAVVSNALDENDRALIINGGSFGKRFVQLCEIYNIKHDELKLELQEKLTKEHLENIDGSKYTVMLVNIHETSVGQLYDINILKEFCKKYNIYLIVDAISSFLSDEYKMDEWGIDCTIISSQKALALAPGLSMIAMNKRFYEDKIKNKPAKNLYLNIEEHLKNMERGQTPFTPAVGVVLELQDRLNNIEKIGKENVIKDTKEKAEYFRNEIKKVDGITIPDYNLSNTLTPIIVKGKATKIFNNLKDKYGIIITPNGGDLKEDVLRVGHIGNLNKSDYDELIKRIKEEL